MSLNELGGFAEWPEDIDGVEEEFKAFNYCLAEEYYFAVLGERFDSLGEIMNDGTIYQEIIASVCKWLNYDGEIGKDKKDDFDKLYNGTIITVNDRSFIEACRDYGWNKLADDLIRNNNEKCFSLKKIK